MKIQFSVNRENGRIVIIEMNPRFSLSSALASKTTGFPAAKIAVGYLFDEIKNDIMHSAAEPQPNQPRKNTDGHGC